MSDPATEALKAERDRLLDEIAELREFERDYRSRLIAWMESELARLKNPAPKENQ